ncbi:MAG: 6-phosphogluconolactonase [Pseudomonadota bacterium]
MKLETYPDRDMMMIDLAQHLAGELENALFTHETVSFAVPGGTTPGPVFDALCAARLEWSRVKVMLTDERWVAESSERSNTRLIKERLLQEKASDAAFVPFFRAGQTAEAAIADVGDSLAASLPLSVLLLGMGADMHTASLFPGAAELDEALKTDAPIMAIHPEGQETRVTLTGRVLAAAMSTHVLIAGDEKRAALERAMTHDAHQAPIKTVLANATVHWAP